MGLASCKKGLLVCSFADRMNILGRYMSRRQVYIDGKEMLHERRQFILRKQAVEHRAACEDDHGVYTLITTTGFQSCGLYLERSVN